MHSGFPPPKYVRVAPKLGHLQRSLSVEPTTWLQKSSSVGNLRLPSFLTRSVSVLCNRDGRSEATCWRQFSLVMWLSNFGLCWISRCDASWMLSRPLAGCSFKAEISGADSMSASDWDTYSLPFLPEQCLFLHDLALLYSSIPKSKSL